MQGKNQGIEKFGRWVLRKRQRLGVRNTPDSVALRAKHDRRNGANSKRRDNARQLRVRQFSITYANFGISNVWTLFVP